MGAVRPLRAGDGARLRALLVALAGVLLSTLANAEAAQGAASWRLEQPAPPAGVPFKVPLGRPGDLQCWSASRCVLATEGNATVPQGLFAWDGVSWHQLSTVCSGPADSTRIVWAGPAEFWTITQPSLPRLGGGLGLCHFRDGVVIASYSTADESPDPFRPMNAGACASPGDCWFAGVGSQDPSGQRAGAYHLHWNGQDLVSTYAPQGRGVSDVVSLGDGSFAETTLVGAQREDRATPVSLATPEAVPLTIHTIASGGAFGSALFAALPRFGVPDDGTELLSADAAAGNVPWFGGGGAASGPGAPADDSVARPPIAVRLVSGVYRELALDETPFGAHDRFADIAAVPGGDDAWAAVQSYAERASTTARARVAHLRPDGSAAVETLPAGGAGRGAAARIEFSGPNEGWMVTNGGWLFHYTDGTPLPQDLDPAFQQLIAYRPNEAVAQAIPDAPPADDSQLFAPPPATDPEPETTPETRVKRVKALMTKVSKPKVDRRLRLHLSFTLRRKAKVALLAKRKGKVVARSQYVLLAPGRHEFVLQLERDRWPDALRFRTADVTVKHR